MLTALLMFVPVYLGANGPAELSISDGDWSLLSQGDSVILSSPEGKEPEALAAIIIPHPAISVWEVIDDKEGAVDWCEGLRVAKVTEAGENYSVVYQELKACFLPGTFKYVIRNTETIPERRVDFKRESGSFKSLEGYWELHPIEEGAQTLVFYQLSIESGLPLPTAFVKDSLEQSLPEALVRLRQQVALTESSVAGAVPQ